MGAGRGQDFDAPIQTVPTLRDGAVWYDRADVSSWYCNGPLGLQQGFVVHKAPNNKSQQALALKVVFEGACQAVADGKGAHLAGGVLEYREQNAWDADGWKRAACLDGSWRLERAVVPSAGGSGGSASEETGVSSFSSGPRSLTLRTKEAFIETLSLPESNSPVWLLPGAHGPGACSRNVARSHPNRCSGYSTVIADGLIAAMAIFIMVDNAQQSDEVRDTQSSAQGRREFLTTGLFVGSGILGYIWAQDCSAFNAQLTKRHIAWRDEARKNRRHVRHIECTVDTQCEGKRICHEGACAELKA